MNVVVSAWFTALLGQLFNSHSTLHYKLMLVANTLPSSIHIHYHCKCKKCKIHLTKCMSWFSSITHVPWTVYTLIGSYFAWIYCLCCFPPEHKLSVAQLCGNIVTSISIMMFSVINLACPRIYIYFCETIYFSNLIPRPFLKHFPWFLSSL